MNSKCLSRQVEQAESADVATVKSIFVPSSSFRVLVIILLINVDMIYSKQIKVKQPAAFTVMLVGRQDAFTKQIHYIKLSFKLNSFYLIERQYFDILTV